MGGRLTKTLLAAAGEGPVFEAALRSGTRVDDLKRDAMRHGFLRSGGTR